MPTFFLVLFLSVFSYAENIPGQQLLNYFSSNCRTQGEWTKSALADSMALIESLRTLIQDPDCKSAAGSIAQLELLNKQLLSMDSLNNTQLQLAEYSAKEQQLLIHLSGASDPDTISAINSELRDTQVQRAALIGKSSAQKDLLGPDKLQMLSGVIQATDDTFRQLTANQKCLANNPSLLTGATGLVSAIGATASIYNPALGLGLSAGSMFLGQTIQGLRDLFLGWKLKALSRQTIAFEAYKCALETMSEKWCQISDAESFLSFRDSQNKTLPPNELGRAIRLSDREFPVILNWLEKIRSGVDPSTTAESGPQSQVFQRESMVNSFRGFGLGLISQKKRELVSVPEADRWPFIRNVIQSLAPGDGGGSFSPGGRDTGTRNPLYEVYVEAYAPFMLMGISETDPSIRNGEGIFYSLQNWPVPTGFKIDLDIIKSNYVAWINRARDIISRERSQVLQPDAEEILSSAYDKTENRFKISPMDALKKMIEFFRSNPPQETNFPFRKIHQSSVQKLSQIYELVNKVMIEQNFEPSSDALKEAVQEIHKLTQLEYGTVVLKSRLDLLIRLAILELMETSRPEDQVLIAQILASERFSDALLKTSGKTTTDIRMDMQNAKPQVIANLDAFIRTFGESIQDILVRLEKEENQSSGTIAENKRYARTQLCYLLLSAPTRPKNVNLNRCVGLSFKPLIQGGPETKPMAINDFTKDYKERACAYREFYRQTKIYEVWKIR